MKIVKLQQRSQDRAKKEILISVERKNSFNHFDASGAFHKNKVPLFFDISQNVVYYKQCYYYAISDSIS